MCPRGARAATARPRTARCSARPTIAPKAIAEIGAHTSKTSRGLSARAAAHRPEARSPKCDRIAAIMRRWNQGFWGILILIGSQGCAHSNRVAEKVMPAVDGSRFSSHPALQVSHVVVESGFQAGTPVAGPNVITVQSREDAAMPFGVVDGEPMRWYQEPPSDAGAATASRMEFPRVRMLSGGSPFGIDNKTRAAESPSIGSQVHIAGFFAADSTAPVEFWKVPPSVVEARVCETPGPHTGHRRSDIFWVAAAMGDYRGFVGGPAGIRNGNGEWEVVGIILFQAAETTPRKEALAILAVQRIGGAQDAVDP